MSFLAIPVLFLISISTLIAWLNDKRRSKFRSSNNSLKDDEATPESKL
jgi:hypothetical protein